MKQKIQGQIPELEWVLGHKVEVIDVNGKKHYGTLDFVGYNSFFPKWGLVCTISRTPQIFIKSINDIKIIEDEG